MDPLGAGKRTSDSRCRRRQAGLAIASIAAQAMLAGYLSVLATVVLTVYGQLIFKWRIDEAGAVPAGSSERLEYVARLAVNPWIVSVIAATFAASLTYGLALTRFDLSHAYPFMALSFVFVLLLSGWFFHESVTTLKVVGVVLIVAGIAIGSQS